MAINDDRWHHIAIIWDGQTGRVTMYLGGVLKASGKDPVLIGEIAGQGLLVISSNATGGLFVCSFPSNDISQKELCFQHPHDTRQQ